MPTKTAVASAAPRPIEALVSRQPSSSERPKNNQLQQRMTSVAVGANKPRIGGGTVSQADHRRTPIGSHDIGDEAVGDAGRPDREGEAG